MLRQSQGAISIIGMIVLPCLIGTAGMVAEYGNGLLVKIQNQRVADLSAYAAAVAYSNALAASSTPDAAQAAMTSAAQGIATLNGFPTTTVAVALVASPNNSATAPVAEAINHSAVRVTITTAVPLIFSRLLGSGSTLSVPSSATVELRPSRESCLLALSTTGAGIPLSGGTTVNAPACAVATNNSASVPCGTNLISKGLNYNGATPTSCNSSPSMRDPSGTTLVPLKKLTADPMANNPEVATARSRITTVANLVSPAAPAGPAVPVVVSPSGTVHDINFSGTGTVDQATVQVSAVALGCISSLSGSTYTLSCTPGTRFFNVVTVAGGISVAFNPNGSGTDTFVFAQPMSTAAAVTFGPGTYYFKQGLTVGYGGITMGAGTLNVIGALNTGGGGTTIASNTINVTGTTILDATTNLTGSGSLNVGGDLTTRGTPSVAQSTIKVSGNFAVTSPATFQNLSTLNVGGEMTVGTYGDMTFGGGDWRISKGLAIGGSSTVTIGSGTFAFGRSGNNCGSGGQYSLCVTTSSPVVFTGPSIFQLSSGVLSGGGTKLTLGTTGITNSFRIGAASDGNAISIGGGATFLMGEATGVASVFELNGNLNIASGGGSCTMVAAASQHDINGILVTAGATILGAGVYTVNGYVGIGSNGGGNVTCNGASYGFYGPGVAMIVSGKTLPTSGPCSGMAFCVAAGYSSVVLTAPTAGTYAKMAVIGPATASGGALFTEGSSSTNLSGLFYLPVGSIRFDGAASVGNGTGQCLQLIGKDITLTGGSVLASTCISGSTSGATVAIIQ